MTKDNVTGKNKDFYDLGKKIFDRLNPIVSYGIVRPAWQKEWVGLTDEERNDCLVEADPCETLAEPEARQLIEEVEAKLREKNG